jgi:hypothetical protein
VHGGIVCFRQIEIEEKCLISWNFNLYDSDFGYSGNIYDLAGATRNGVIYPSLDPSIFEVKFPNKDIKGRVVNY